MNIEPNKIKVLVVDDVSSARKSLILILRQIGIKNVTEAKSSMEALERLQKETFQLIISDWEMPDINGLELLTMVKEGHTHKNIPFIMITSASEKDRVIKALEAGVTDYAIKPICLETLSNKILRVFSNI
jgi:two-component system chemotaxis response regulator CheY